MKRSLAVWLALVLTCAVVSVAAACPPDPAECTIQAPHLLVVGAAGGVADPAGAWTVVVRGFAGVPIAGSTVLIDFRQCSDIQLACDQSVVANQVHSGPGYVFGITDRDGRFIFNVQGSATGQHLDNGGISPGTNAGTPCATVYADGVMLGTVVVAALDVNGHGSPNAIDAADVAQVLADALSSSLGATPRARDDYNFDSQVTAADVAVVLHADLMRTTRVTGPTCP